MTSRLFNVSFLPYSILLLGCLGALSVLFPATIPYSF